MIYDFHTHHHPDIPGEAIVQLTPDAFHRLPGHIYSVGLHPWDISKDWPILMGKLLVMALHPQVLMIGEAGMDKKNGTAPIELQIEVFREHVHLSEIVRKPLIVHCVKAIDELLAIRKETKATQPWIIHGYRGGMKQWQQLTHAGLYVSLGKHHDTLLIKELPLANLLLESDDLDDIDSIYTLISKSTNTDSTILKHQVDANIRRLFNMYDVG